MELEVDAFWVDDAVSSWADTGSVHQKNAAKRVMRERVIRRVCIMCRIVAERIFEIKPWGCSRTDPNQRDFF